MNGPLCVITDRIVEVLKRDVRIVRPGRLHESWSGYADRDLYCHRALLKVVAR